MSRDDFSGMMSYVCGAASLAGLIYFKCLPKPDPLDFIGQMHLSRIAFWIGVPASSIVVLAGFFRQGQRTRIVTVIYGFAVLFLWLIIAAGNLPVA